MTSVKVTQALGACGVGEGELAKEVKDYVNVWMESNGHEELAGLVVGGRLVFSSSRFRTAGTAPDETEAFTRVTIGRCFGCGRYNSQ